MTTSEDKFGDEIEVTTEMIRAGLEAFAGFNEDFERREDRLLAVYRAMALMAPAPSPLAAELHHPESAFLE